MANNKALNLTVKVNDKEAKQSFKEINGEYYKLRNSVNKLEEGTDEWTAANKRLAKVEAEREGMIKRQKAFREELAKTIETTEGQTSAMEEFAGHFGDAFSSLRQGDILGFRTAMIGLGAGIKTATAAAWAFVATPLGAAIATAAAIVLATREWFKYNEAAAEANMVTQQITRLSGDALDQARVRAAAIEKTFGTEFKETLNVATSLVEAFGISYEEAFDKIENGLIRGGQQNDEFLKSFKEYPKLFAQAGFTVEDFQRIVNTGIDMSIYDDKLPDAIKEFSLSMMEGTKSTRDAMENAFGKDFTDGLFENIKNGSISSKDALQQISAEAERIGLNAQQAQQLTADLFRGAGEDAGGALLIFEAINTALNEQERALTPIEGHLKRIADANRELGEAQDEALKSDQYAAFATELEVTWIKAKADFYNFITAISEGLITADTAFRRFVFQSVQYVKDAFTIGADADWEELGKKFDEQQKKIEESAAKIQKQKRKEQDPAAQAALEAEKKRHEEEEKAAKAAEKLKEQQAKEAAAAKKKRLEELDRIEEEYLLKKQQREANSAVKTAELERDRAIQKAEALGAEQELLDQIRAEHQVKINEAKAEEEAKELQRVQDFEARKKALLDEMEIEKAKTDEEKEILKAEQQYEKEMLQLERDLENLKLNTEEKQELERIMAEAHEAVLQDIHDKANKKKLESDAELYENRKRLINQTLDAAISAAGQETKMGQALIIAKQALAIKETAIQLRLFQNKLALNIGSASGDIAAGTAKTASVGFPQNIPLLIGFAAQIAGIIGAIRNAAKSKSEVKTSFARGGYTDLFGMGYKDSTGHEVAGDVHVGEYVVPKVVRQDPEVPQILDYLERKRKKKLGLYADGGDTLSGNPATASGASSNETAVLVQVVEKLIQKLDEPLVSNILFGYEAEQERQRQQKKLEKIQTRSKVKK